MMTMEAPGRGGEAPKPVTKEEISIWSFRDLWLTRMKDVIFPVLTCRSCRCRAAVLRFLPIFTAFLFFGFERWILPPQKSSVALASLKMRFRSGCECSAARENGLGHGEKGPQQGHLLARPEDLRQGPKGAAQGQLFGCCIWLMDWWLGISGIPAEDDAPSNALKNPSNGTSRKIDRWFDGFLTVTSFFFGVHWSAVFGRAHPFWRSCPGQYPWEGLEAADEVPWVEMMINC